MTWFEALVLGIIQGLTEFLPLSSSGHLEIGAVLLKTKSSDNLLFAVIVHLATALATIAVFRSDITLILKDVLKFEWNESTQFVTKILISIVPVFLVGVFFQDQIEALFSGNLLLVGSMLLITATLLLYAHFEKEGTKNVEYVSSFIIGLSQAFAILPGISRSGSTIATALILGIEKTKATCFSFLMVLIPILGASLLKLKECVENPAEHTVSFLTLIVGFVSALITGFVACKWMLTIVKRGKLTYFAIYCLVVGLIAIVGSLY